MKISPRIVLIKDFVQERCDSPEPGFSEKELALAFKHLIEKETVSIIPLSLDQEAI